MKAQKKALRTTWLKQRKQMADSDIHMKSQHIQNHIIAWLKTQDVRNVGLYVPIQNEVDIRPLCEHVRCLYPKIDQTLHFFDDTQGFSLGPMGTKEPIGTTPVPPEAIDVLLIPGIAFDLMGYRLGYGKGYFDRYLENYQGVTIGITIETFLVESLPHEKHDQPVAFVVTENGFWRSR